MTVQIPATLDAHGAEAVITHHRRYEDGQAMLTGTLFVALLSLFAWLLPLGLAFSRLSRPLARSASPCRCSGLWC